MMGQMEFDFTVSVDTDKIKALFADIVTVAVDKAMDRLRVVPAAKNKEWLGWSDIHEKYVISRGSITKARKAGRIRFKQVDGFFVYSTSDLERLYADRDKALPTDVIDRGIRSRFKNQVENEREKKERFVRSQERKARESEILPKAIELGKKGYNMNMIAEKLGIYRGFIERLLGAGFVPPVTPDSEIVRMYVDNLMKIEDIASNIHRKVGYVHKVLKRNGIQTRRKARARTADRLPQAQVGDIAARYTQDLQSKESIAKHYGVGEKIIADVLNRQGVALRRAEDCYIYRFTKEQENQIVDMYVNQMMSLNALGRAYSTTHQAIKQILQRHKIQTRDWREEAKRCQPIRPCCETSDEMQRQIIQMRMGSVTPLDIATKLGIAASRVRWVIDASGLDFPPLQYKRTVLVNEQFFDEWNSVNAYVAGMLAADGNVSDGGSVSLSLIDRDVVLAVAKAFGGNLVDYIKCRHTRESRPNEKPIYTFTFISRVVAAKLAEIGIVPRKSLIIQWPTQIPDEFMPHYIRGVFDGDGHVDKSGYSASVCSGSVEFARGLRRSLFLRLGIPIQIQVDDRDKYNGHPVYVVHLRGFAVGGFADLIYDCMGKHDIAMQRKKVRF